MFDPEYLPKEMRDDRYTIFAQIATKLLEIPSLNIYDLDNLPTDRLDEVAAYWGVGSRGYDLLTNESDRREFLKAIPELLRLENSVAGLKKVFSLFGYSIDIVENPSVGGVTRLGEYSLIAPPPQTGALSDAQIRMLANYWTPIRSHLLDILLYVALYLDGSELLAGGFGLDGTRKPYDPIADVPSDINYPNNPIRNAPVRELETGDLQSASVFNQTYKGLFQRLDYIKQECDRLLEEIEDLVNPTQNVSAAVQYAQANAQPYTPTLDELANTLDPNTSPIGGKNGVLTADNSGGLVLVPESIIFTDIKHAVIYERFDSNQASGTNLTPNVWTNRALNTIDFNDGFVTLDSSIGRVTLPAGRYEFSGYTLVAAAGRSFKSRLFDRTNNVPIAMSVTGVQSQRLGAGEYFNSVQLLSGYAEFTTTVDLTIDSWISLDTNGAIGDVAFTVGYPSAEYNPADFAGIPETYSCLQITKYG